MVGPYIKFISNSSLMTIFIRAFCRAIFLITLDILINIIFLLKPISSHFFFYLISLNLYFPIKSKKLLKDLGIDINEKIEITLNGEEIILKKVKKYANLDDLFKDCELLTTKVESFIR